jgi:hypothetical protein
MTALIIGLSICLIGLLVFAFDSRQKSSALKTENDLLKGLAARVESEAKSKADAIINNGKQKAEEMLRAAMLDTQAVHEKAAGIEAGLEKRKIEVDKQVLDYAGKIDLSKTELKKIEMSLKEAQAFETALRHKLNGVGSEYILPIHSLIDELADHMSYDVAGVKLKAARENTRLMIKNGMAVTCNWGDEAYKLDAVKLMLETFNALVDVALEKVKRDENIGIVSQEIKDAYAELNEYGTRCMRASVNQQFLESRLNEAKWACIASELRYQEREEQKAMTARLKEEGRVQREIEKAQREAGEEEERVRRAMAKAEEQAQKHKAEMQAKFEAEMKEMQKALLKAEAKGEEERKRLEAEITEKMEALKRENTAETAKEVAALEQDKEELERRLKEAEEKNRRALSMAQQTKRGYVYVISNTGSFGESMVKIGMTRRLEPQDRIDELGDASVPFEFDIHAMIRSDDAPGLENDLHRVFAENRVNKVNHRKEFFRVSIRDIREVLESRKVNTEWTMAAKAKEYHETVAWEQAMKADPAAKARWAEAFGAQRVK